MSTGPEHYREAERLLDLAERTDCDPMSIIASAQVHATLALFAGVREIGDQLDTVPRPRQPRVCMIPDCGCDGTWHP
jgi:acetyl-CoA carboxylase alpha subunit